MLPPREKERESRMSENLFDLIVIGGGPGGATVASLVAMQGHRVLLLERERFPRYHIGESLLPATVHGICAMLGVDEEVRACNFMKKYGGTFRWGRLPDLWSFKFNDSKLFDGRPDYAYQVIRSKFDEIMLRNASRKGVDVREEHSAREVLFEDGRAVGVRFTDHTGGGEKTARARYVVDASGLHSLLAERIGERTQDDFFQNIALFGYYKDAKRMPGENAKGNLISAAFKDGWFWFIPLSDELTSVGVVLPREHAGRLKELGLEQAMVQYIDACPVMKDFLGPATRVTEGEYAPLRVLKDYSYAHSRFWAPGAALVGDSACFIDPIFSSGVHLATYAGLLAARSINTCLAGAPVEEARCFREFELRYRREFGVFYEFLLGFYEMHDDTDSYFWKARKVLKDARADDSAKEAFVRLVSGLSSTGEPLFASAGAFLESARKQGDVMQALSEAQASGGAIPAELRGEVQRRGAIFFRERMQMWEIHSRKEGKDGPVAGSTLEKPMFDQGLIPSADGMHWQEPAADSAG
jgi:FAD-dependent halogenase